nr:hypothetical protein [Shigella dysenteriae]
MRSTKKVIGTFIEKHMFY